MEPPTVEAPVGGPESTISPQDAARLQEATDAFRDRGFNIAARSESTVDLVRELQFSFWRWLLAGVFFYPQAYGVMPLAQVWLRIDGDRVMVRQQSGRPGPWVMVPMGLLFAVYCAMSLLALGWAMGGGEYLLATVRTTVLAIGGYGVWIVVGTAVRMSCGATPPAVPLPELAPERRRADDQTPEERLLIFLDAEAIVGYRVIAYDGRRAELRRPGWWPSNSFLAEIMAGGRQ